MTEKEYQTLINKDFPDYTFSDENIDDYINSKGRKPVRICLGKIVRKKDIEEKLKKIENENNKKSSK